MTTTPIVVTKDITQGGSLGRIISVDLLTDNWKKHSCMTSQCLANLSQAHDDSEMIMVSKDSHVKPFAFLAEKYIKLYLNGTTFNHQDNKYTIQNFLTGFRNLQSGNDVDKEKFMRAKVRLQFEDNNAADPDSISVRFVLENSPLDGFHIGYIPKIFNKTLREFFLNNENYASLNRSKKIISEMKFNFEIHDNEKIWFSSKFKEDDYRNPYYNQYNDKWGNTYYENSEKKCPIPGNYSSRRYAPYGYIKERRTQGSLPAFLVPRITLPVFIPNHTTPTIYNRFELIDD